MRTIIVTASDEQYSHLFRGLLASLYQWQKPLAGAIGVLDLGLSQNTKDQLRSRVDYIVEPEWDLVVRKDIAESSPYLRAMTARPFLRKYFPGFDIYIWLDSDTWIQNRSAIDWLIAGSRDRSLAIVPQVHQSYRQHPTSINWRLSRLNAYYSSRLSRFKAYYSSEAVKMYSTNTYYNSGVWALQHDAPHWDTWAHYFELGLAKASDVVTDQTALNYAIWKTRLSVHPLPARCNWCCQLAVPALNKQKVLVEPHIPHEELAIVHLAGQTHRKKFTFVYNDQQMELDLQYETMRRFRLGAVAEVKEDG